jgi:hypothetical protein
MNKLLLLLLLPLNLLAQPVSGPATATSNSVATFLDNKHLRNNPALLFDGTNLTINGVPVLTNSGSIGPGIVSRLARWTGTNTLGDGRIIDNGRVMAIGFPTNDVPNLNGITNSVEIIGIGHDALSGATITNASGVFAFGNNALTTMTLGSGSGGVYALGTDVGDSLFVLGTSGEIHAIGPTAMSQTTLTNNVQAVFAYGRGSLGFSTVNNSVDLYSFGLFNMDSTLISGSSGIYSFGENGLGGAHLTNSSDVYTFGKDAGANLSGIFSHVFLIGSGATATGNNQWVAGDSAYQYKFPGTAGFILGGTTNQITFGGTNTAPVSAVAPTKWISVQVAGLTNAFRVPLFE